MAALRWWPPSLLDAVTDQLSGGYSRLRNGRMEEDNALPLSEEKQANSIRLSQIGWYLLPSFIARRYNHSDVEIPKPNATSYLNGLRGVAATIVVILHTTSEWFFYINVAYVATPPDNRIIQMPFIRVLTSGHFMVAIFFVLSGFVLSYGPLKKAHADNSSAAIAGLPGSTLRRPIRLFLPVLPVFLVTSISTYIQIFWRDYSTELQPSKGSLWADLSDGLHQWTVLAWRPLDWEPYHPISNPVCWTLGVEFQGSLAIFFMMLALGRISPWLRITLVTICAWDAFCNNPGRWSIFLFLVGMVLADMRHVRAKLPHPPRQVRLAVKVGSYLLLILALFFGGWPAMGAEKGMWFSYFATWPTYGHEHMGANYFWFSIAAVMLMVALENLPELHNFFNHPVFLYLGEISYGLYLIHYFIFHTLEKSIIFGLRHRGVDDFTSAVIGGAIAMTTAIWVADVFWRLVDQKSIKFARWAVEKMGV